MSIQDQLDYPQYRKKIWTGIEVDHHNVLTTVIHVWYIDIVRYIDMGQRDHNNDCINLPLKHGLVVKDQDQVILHLEKLNHNPEHSHQQHLDDQA